jgi:DNA repair protein RadC
MIQTTPKLERPRERCLQNGPQSLSLRECLALLIGSGPSGIGCLGIAGKLLDKPGKNLPPSEEERAFFQGLEVSGLGHLSDISGLGPAGKSKILAAFELGRRYSHYRAKHPGTTPQPSHLLSVSALNQVTQELRSSPQEWFGFVSLYSNQRLGELCVIEKGARTHVNLDPAELFSRILALRPLGIILFHNHPSGNVTPSQEDLALTQKVRELLQEFRISLIGHWIVSPFDEYWVG